MSNHTPAIRPTAQSVMASPAPTLALMDPIQFDQMQRVGKMLALSPLFPEHLRKGSEAEKIANGVLVMNMAVRLREDPLTVAQNIYFVGGRPGWNTTYMIAKANMHGVFKDPIDWDVKGAGDKLSVTAFAVLVGTGKRVQMTADMDMAKAEGWTRNTKYKSIPETMLRYRSAAALIRMYCPEVMIGIPAGIEVETEMRDVTPRHAPEVEAVVEQVTEVADAEIVDPETGEVTQADEATGNDAGQQADPARDKPEEASYEDRPSRRQKSSEASKSQGEMSGMWSISDLIKKIDQSIRDNLTDGAPLDETLELFELQLNQIKQEAPDEHAAMIEEYRAFVAERDA